MTIQPAVEITDESFEEEVLCSPVPVLVNFYARWCPPCRALSPIVDEVATEVAGVYKVVKVNVERCPTLTRRYRVQSVPLLLLFKDGEIRERITDSVGKAALLNTLSSLT